MQRIKEKFLEKVEQTIPLDGLDVLEIGCGDGTRSVAIAARCKTLNAIDPDVEKVKSARKLNIHNATFETGSGDQLAFGDRSFDLAIFTLSLHHIPIEKMMTAIDEAVRVVRKACHLVFLEPAEEGTFFDAEIEFDACDGDERKEKTAAYRAMKKHGKLMPVLELGDETIFQFESVDDFVQSMNPKKNLTEIKAFLESNHYILKAGRRINIFQAK